MREGFVTAIEVGTVHRLDWWHRRARGGVFEVASLARSGGGAVHHYATFPVGNWRIACVGYGIVAL